MSRFLITGSAGFIGSRLTRRLIQQSGNEVFSVVRPGGTPAIGFHQQILRADLTDRAETERAFRQSKPEIVIHCAMTGGHPASASARLEALNTGVIGTANVAEAAIACGVKRFVHLGSFLVYRQQDRAVRESDPVDPYSFRGAAKAGASLWLQQCARLCGLPLVELRIFSVYGPGEPAHRFIPALLRAARDRSAVPLAPEPRHDFVYVDDVVQACLLAADADLPAGSIFNIGGGQAWRNDEVIRVASLATGCNIAIQPGGYPASPADAGYWQADISEAIARLRWRPAVTLEEGIRATFQCLLKSASA